MSWISALPTVLQLVLTILKWAQQKQLLAAGQDQAIAEMSLQILESTKAGKEIRERIRALDDDTADKLWDDMLNV